MKRRARSRARSGDAGRVRIIAGRDRGRVLRFHAVDGLRPTGDRVRETLFNWLQPRLPGARCLDMFAGSGALGFEAASRGAAKVDMYERSCIALDDLSRNLQLLGAGAVDLHAEDVLQMRRVGAPYDIVFIDPPFDAQLHNAAIALLDRQQLLNGGALVYLEWPAKAAPPATPAHWQCRRDKVAGDVGFALFDAGSVNIASQ